METILRNVWSGFVEGSVLDQVNLVLGVLGVWLMTRRSLWAFPVGLVAVSVQCILFFRTKFYADAALQVFFFVALAWGWRHWARGKGEERELPVTTLTWRGRAACVVGVAVATAAWALVAERITDARMPWRDAAIAMLQVAGQVLQARKNLENWALFTAANLIAIPAYWSAELAYTALLFGVYLVLGLVGWVAWWRAWRTAKRAGMEIELQPRRVAKGRE